MRTSISAMAAMLAAASFGGSAFAEGDYFEGTSKTRTGTQVDTRSAAPELGRADVDFVTTGSIANIRLDNLDNDRPVFPRTNRDNR